MKNLGEVSIIIPFYNGEKYIRSCVRSLLAQTYPFFKAYLIDDGSTDRSVEMLREIDEPRLVLLRQKRAGASAARNLGLDRQEGDFLAFMDVDDELCPDFLEKMVTAVCERQADIVMCNFIRLYAKGESAPDLLPWADETIDQREIHEKLLPQLIWREKGLPAIMGAVWRLLIRRAFWEKQKVYFPVGISAAEDLLFSLSLFHRAKTIHVRKDCLYLYHMNAASAIHSRSASQMDRPFFHHLRLVLQEEGLLPAYRQQYDARLSSGYASVISYHALQKNVWAFTQAMKALRQELLYEPYGPGSPALLSAECRISLQMLRYRLYVPLFLLCRLKEWLKKLLLGRSSPELIP